MNKNYLFVTIFLFALVAAGAYFIYKIPSSPAPIDQLSQNSVPSDNISSSDSASTLGVETSPTPVASDSANVKMDEKLIIQDETVGTGAGAIAGKKVTVNYVGTLTNGTKFDSSYDRNQPFSFNLGGGEVIQGWDQGVVGMKVGGKRKLTIPPSLGYGSQDMGAIPPNSTLIFEVELLKVE
jgi:FKBP-type peptidyl-prolyl cis-trans isomerase